MYTAFGRMLVVSLFAGSLLLAQESSQISGTVRDSSGAAIVGAQVTVTEPETRFSRVVTTGAEGDYVIPALRPTRYDLSVTAQGFRPYQQKGVQVLAAQSLTIPIALELGPVTESVTVQSEVVQVNTTTATLSEVVERARIVELPLNGRDAAQLTTLVAGTTVISVAKESGQAIPGALQVSSGGSRWGQVTYKLDGASNRDYLFGRNQTFPFPDAVQEFSIQTSNYSASEGSNAGAVVNVYTRSGTNNFHGGAFEFVRNGYFNAKSYFAKQADLLKRNQYGGFLGGPIRLPGYDGRNKTFFFAGWQGTQLRNQDNTQTSFTPTIDQRLGNFSTCGTPCNVTIRDPLSGSPFPGNQIPVSRFDAAAVNVNKMLPAIGGTGFTVVPVNISQRLNEGVVRIDHQLTTKDRISGRYYINDFENAPSYTPGNLLTYIVNTTNGSNIRLQNGIVSWIRTITPSFLSDFHVDVNRTYSRRFAPPGVPGMDSLGVRLPFYTDLPTIDQIQVTGSFRIGDNEGATFPRTGFEFSERMSLTKGHHNMQFGGDVTRIRFNDTNGFLQAGQFVFTGNTTGSAMADYFLGKMGNFNQGSGEIKYFRTTYASLFFADDLKLAPRFTLNLGIRYEPSPPWHETGGRFELFDPQRFFSGTKSTRFANAPPGVFFRGDPGVPEDGTLGDYNNVSGRFGFAWDVRGDGKTSVRGGVGMFYNQMEGSGFNNYGVNAPPWAVRLAVTNPPGTFSDPFLGRNDFNTFSRAAAGTPNAPFPAPVTLSTYDGRWNTPLSYNWNLTVEREVVSGWLLRAGYVGSALNYGRNTPTSSDGSSAQGFEFNPAVYIPGTNAAGQALSSTGNTDARRRFAPLGPIMIYTEDRRSYYHSLQTSLTKRLSHGFTILANYTFSKTVDTFGLVVPVNVPDTTGLSRGPSPFDHKHRTVASYVWQLPKTSVNNTFARAILNGWQLSGIIQYQTGSPLTIVSGRDNSLTAMNADRAKLTGVSRVPLAGSNKLVWFNPAAFAVNDIGTFGTVGKGAFYGPNLFTWQKAIAREIKLRESLAVQIKGEFFNILNHPNFDNPVQSVTASGFGSITAVSPTGGDPRIMQFSAKLTF